VELLGLLVIGRRFFKKGNIMKIIEAMKKVKANKAKIADLQTKISQISAHLSHETPLYGTQTPEKINEWTQSCEDLSQDNIRLLVSIALTNLKTNATIELGGRQVTKTLAEWVWRRREYAALDLRTYSVMTDRGLKEGTFNASTGVPMEVKLVRNYNPERKDKKMAEFQSEPHDIDSALEVVNAVTDLVEQ
jgi:hypothetical protein